MKKILFIFLLLISFISVSIASQVNFSEESLKIKNDSKSSIEFSVSFEDAKEIIKKHYPQLQSNEEILDFIMERDIQRIQVNGGLLLFSDFEQNLFYRDPQLVTRTPEWSKKKSGLIVDLLEEYDQKKNITDGFKSRLTPYFKPREFFVEYSINTPRNLLPEKGFLKLWIPLPLHIPAQQNIAIVEIEPQKAIVGNPITFGDIACVLLNFDLADLEEDLNVNIQYAYTRFQQEFKIDQDRIGPYDENSSLYKEYTKSYKNTVYDERFKKLAKKIIEDETNPYLQAKKIYDYIIKNINYSLMAHAYLEAEEIPESVFVFEHGFGDCGSQSIFFTALCRSIGIPARTTGGFQLFMSNLGSHFWAEFYLPNYGWIPVDTSVGQATNYIPDLTENQRQAFKEFFFARQDPLRLTVQNDIDLFPDEKPEDIQVLSMVLQNPYIDCEFGNESFEVSSEILQRIKTKLRVIK